MVTWGTDTGLEFAFEKPVIVDYTGIFMCVLRRHVKNPCTALVTLCKVREVTAVLDIEHEPG